ncbi:hypothetical protein ACT91Q_05745 [Brevibacillus thermoruber]|uniref:magnesium chelatase subunit ChlI family protein n=1 Tax=Brevibacillus thermoruber TaxID=33942 RepID=UPI0040436874
MRALPAPPRAPFNSAMNGEELRRYAGLDREGRKLLQLAFETLGLSARAYNRIVKVARTIADLAGAEQIEAAHVAEADPVMGIFIPGHMD